MCHQPRALYPSCGCLHNIKPQPQRCDEYKRGLCNAVNRDVVSEHQDRVCGQCVVLLRAAIRRLFQLIDNDVRSMDDRIYRQQVADARIRSAAKA